MNTQAPMERDQALITFVDLLRGLLALMVLLAHGLESAHLALPSASFPAVLDFTLARGGYWVSGFFVLSGFCIHRSILAQLAQGSGLATGYYALARISRIYPVYLVALILALASSTWPSPLMISGHLLMMQGITGVLPAIKPAWSLTNEMVYYAVWPAILISCRFRVVRSFAFAFAASALVAGLLFGLWKSIHAGVADSTCLALALVAASFPLWLGGAALAHWWDVLQRRSQAWMTWAGLLLLITGYGAQAWLMHLNARTMILCAVTYVSLPGWLLLLLGGSVWRGFARWRSCATWMGLLSYPLYIMHQPLLNITASAMRHLVPASSLAMFTLLLVAVVLTIVISIGVPLERWTLGKRGELLRRLRSRQARTFPIVPQ